MRKIVYSLVCLTLPLMTGCNRPPKVEGDFPEMRKDWRSYKKFGGITDKGGISLLGGDSKAGVQFPVNSYLWQASLDTLNFMPFAKISPEEGIIQTEWTNVPDVPSEQFQVMVHITGEHLFSHLLNVAAHRRVKGKDGGWINAETHAETTFKLKNAILNKARELKSNRSPNS
jgi:hypothetical protein